MHPLITEDAFTLGAGFWQLEVGFEQSRDAIEGLTSRGKLLAPVLSYGVTDTADLLLRVPYFWLKTDGIPDRTSGFGDASLDVKWRFYESPFVSIALKPGLTFATGDTEEGLGIGRSALNTVLVFTFVLGDWDFHLHPGYTRNRNNVGLRRDLFHFSGAAMFHATESLKFAADVSVDSNPLPSDSRYPAVLLAAVIYTPRPDLDLDLGVKLGLNEVAPDVTWLAGVTVRW